MNRLNSNLILRSGRFFCNRRKNNFVHLKFNRKSFVVKNSSQLNSNSIFYRKFSSETDVNSESTTKPTSKFITSELENEKIDSKPSQSDLQRSLNKRLKSVSNGKEILEILKIAEDAGWMSNFLTYELALAKCVGFGDMNYAEKIVERAIERELKVDSTWFNKLMYGYSRIPDTSMMLKLRSRMSENSAVADIETFQHLLYGFAFEGNLETTSDLLQEMIDSGLPCDINSWNAILAGCAANSSQTGIRETLMAMERSKIQPNADTYDIRIRLDVEQKNFVRAIALIEEMHELKLTRNKHVLLMLLNSMMAHPKEADPHQFQRVVELIRAERE